MTEQPSISSLIPNPTEVNCLCIGSGRFLRSVLVPALNAANYKPAIIQTRGRTFLDYCCNGDGSGDSEGSASSQLSYEVDVVEYDGQISTEHVKCYGAGTLGTQQGREDAMDLLQDMKTISVIGVGVTEAGLSGPTSPSLIHLAAILQKIHSLLSSKSLSCPNPNGKICVINTDNVPSNGTVIRKYLLEIAASQNTDASASDASAFEQFLRDGVVFHDTMVDRITSQRDGSGMVPRCEPVPCKALVIQDLGGDLPAIFSSAELKSKCGAVVRTKAGQLDGDIALKLRVANGTHTAVAHVMALSSLLMTDVLSKDDTDERAAILMKYLDSYFDRQVLVAAQDEFGKEECEAVYKDWRRRLCHPKFGLSTFFITQNGAAKGGIRIGPTIRDCINSGKAVDSGKAVAVTTSFAIAAILRFLTPDEPTANPVNGIYRGWLDGFCRISAATADGSPGETITYADGLRYNLKEGWYEFRGSCNVAVGPASAKERPICEVLGAFGETEQPISYLAAIQAYLAKEDGGDLADIMANEMTSPTALTFAMSVATLYARMVCGDGMLNILGELCTDWPGFDTKCNAMVDGVSPLKMNDRFPLHYRESAIPPGSKLLNAQVGTDATDIASVIFAEVSSVAAIDLHTHLLPPSHGALCCWGIDELLTYHYLVAEYFMTAPAAITPELFYAKSKRDQADIVWKALFIDHSPVSEACRGVITTLTAFGLSEEVKARDLSAIRKFYHAFRDKGLAGSEEFCSKIYQLSGVRYAVMTNVPFDANEVQHWRPKRKEYPNQFRSALRVDPLLAGDRNTIEAALKGSGYECTLEGARQYLRDWCDTMKPEYMMASTPHNFLLREGKGNLAGFKKDGVNEDAMKEPFAFTDVVASDANCATKCDGEDDATASVIDEKSDFLSEVLMKVCEERDLPLALKIGAHRGVNAKLLQAGDGVVAFADGGVLARLCSRFPGVRFLATFLSMNNQHEACVLASKFRNLHIYGCWWFCNNPSMIESITKMRVEMLGTAFTAQHSDARVMDQLVYKWAHSRAVIANVLAKEYQKTVGSGWTPTRGEIRRDVERLFGGSYEEFMSKSLIEL